MLIALFVAAVLTPADPIIGRASVIDGDTIEIRGQRIRLWGIDAPEGRQTCTRRGATYRCGQEAALALSDWLGSSLVACTARGRPDRYRRIVAQCRRVGPQYGFDMPVHDLLDLGDWLVGQGWALDYPRYSAGAYATAEAAASERKAGMWAGEFQRPWEWRAR